MLNQDHALLYSAGDLYIGGRLNKDNQASGQAGTVKNYSVNIEARDNLLIDTAILENKDIHLKLTDKPVEVSRESRHEF
ncbi:hypothetical protein [Xenorhabdus cabanillasii]|uniref:hypothetical protein n=1 Tax=Xenorhabdus cabanillasii TaxID=351673 RepID=UPI0011457A5D|nr:hypothetical protein [Xenorhabdus cabanillasii]